jgi:hypothetical protein
VSEQRVCVSLAIKSRARDAEWQCIFLVHQAMCGARLHLAQWVWCCAELQVIILARPAQPWHANIIGSHTHIHGAAA